MARTHQSPLLAMATAFAAGIVVSSLAKSPGILGLLLCSLLAAALFWISHRRITAGLEKAAWVSVLTCFLVAGWVLGELSAVIPGSDPSHFIGKEVEIQGFVADDVRRGAHGYRTVLQITGPLEGRVILYLPADAKAPGTNDRLHGTVKLQALPQKNPGYANWLHHQGIHAVAKSVHLAQVGRESGFRASLRDVRNAISKQFAAVFPNATTAGLGNAMLLGNRTNLDGEIRKDFSATGLSHIVAISGMNFAIIYAVLHFLLHPMLFIRGGRQVRSMIVVLLLAFFAMLTGGNPAVVRAAIMLGMIGVGQAFWAKSNSLNALATSALIFLAYDPQSLFMPDFQLSYAAVLGILVWQARILRYLHLRLPKLPRWLSSPVAVTLAAQAATTPLVAFHFDTFPTYFLLANLAVLPVVTLIVQIGFAGFVVAWIPGLSRAWGGVMDFMLWSVTGMADVIARLPGATITALQADQAGIWILTGQVLLAFAILEGRYLNKAFGYLRRGGANHIARVAVAGILRRAAFAAAVIGWALLGFLA